MSANKKYRLFLSLTVVITFFLFLGLWLSTVGADSLSFSYKQKATTFGGFRTPDPNATLVVIERSAHVLSSPLHSPLSSDLAPYFDDTPPTSTLYFSGAVGLDGWYRSPITVNFQVSDDHDWALVYYRVPDNALAPWLEWKRWQPPPVVTQEGEYSMGYYAIDKLENIESPPNTTTIKIDLTPPTTSTQVEAMPSGIYKVTLASSDVLSGPDYTRYRLVSLSDPEQSTDEWRVYTSPLELADGQYLLEVYAVDLAGNQEAVITSTFGPITP